MISVYIDLDDSLLDRKTVYQITIADKPDKVLYTLTESDYVLMNTLWKRYDLKFKNPVDGKSFWLSERVWESIKGKRKGIELHHLAVYESDAGVSLRENAVFGTSLAHLRNIDCDIHLICNMHLDDKDDYMGKVIKFVEENTGKEVVKTYYVDDIVQDNSRAISTKMKLVLEGLIGYKVKANRFTSLRKAIPEEVRYYTSDQSTATMLYNIQSIFEKCLLASDSAIQKEVKERGVIAPLKMAYITNNKLNKFKVLTIELLYPRYIRKFEDYKG